MGCNCKNKKKKITMENENPVIRKQKEQEIVKLRENIRKNLSNFKRLTR